MRARGFWGCKKEVSPTPISHEKKVSLEKINSPLTVWQSKLTADYTDATSYEQIVSLPLHVFAEILLTKNKNAHKKSKNISHCWMYLNLGSKGKLKNTTALKFRYTYIFLQT